MTICGCKGGKDGSFCSVKHKEFCLNKLNENGKAVQEIMSLILEQQGRFSSHFSKEEEFILVTLLEKWLKSSCFIYDGGRFKEEDRKYYEYNLRNHFFGMLKYE